LCCNALQAVLGSTRDQHVVTIGVGILDHRRRCLCLQVLLLDELTTFLDYEDQEKVLQCVRDIVDASRQQQAAAAAAGSETGGGGETAPRAALPPVTALWVTHRLEELQYADSVR
jgi:ABC-type multidrug transport system fused ATPase/permease subunit